MAHYEVIATFEDLQDNRHRYQAGDEYPREGLSPSKERIEELATNKNRLGRPFIKLHQDPKTEEPKSEPTEKTEPKPASKKRTKKKS